MFRIDRLKYRIKSDEGFRSDPYQDTEGVWTIGYGTTWYLSGPVHAFTPAIERSEAARLLQADVLDAIEDCQYIYEDVFPALHSVHQEVLICLAYQLGRKGLIGFKRMNKAIHNLDYAGWLVELKDSKLYRQATNRCDRYVTAIVQAAWPTINR